MSALQCVSFGCAPPPKLKTSSFCGPQVCRHPKTKPRRNRQHWTCALPVPLRKLSNDLVKQQDATARYLHLASLGDCLNQIPQEGLVPATRVPGCTSVTHIDVVLKTDGTVSLSGFSDARISRGILALLVHGLEGAHVRDVMNLTTEEILSASGLQGSVSQTRINGLGAILREIQRRLADKRTAPRAEPARWTDREPDDVAVLLSGGVDSSVALRLAMAAGARVHAFYLKIWLDDELSHLGSCPWEADLAAARAVCEQAGVTLHDVPFQQEYWDEVVSYTVSEARAGRTPNPDVMCNTRIKFGAFYERIGRDFARVVTGHYAQTRETQGGTELLVSKDAVKDQTYFLAHLQQHQLAKAWFPVGGYTKDEVRGLARELELPNHGRADSQGICFLGKLKFEEFLRHHLGERRGSLVEFESGREVGLHRGFWFFTVGQRRGVGLSGGPWYVVCKDAERNVVYVSRRYDGVEQARNAFGFEGAVWVAGTWPGGLAHAGDAMRVRVKTRHGPLFHEGVLTRTGAREGAVRLEKRDKGLAAGQFAAFYDFEGRCLGSGVICSDASLRGVPREIHRMDKSSVRLQAHW